MNKREPKLNIKLETITVKSECQTCKTKPLMREEWHEGHWGCINCGDPNKKQNNNE